MDNKGFYYYLEDEKIEEYSKLSVEQKLQWLEEVNEFTNLFLTQEEKELRTKLKTGQI